MTARGVRTLCLSEADALASALRGADVILTPLVAAAFGAQVTEFVLGDLLLQIGCSAPMMMLGEVAADAVWIQLPLSGHAGLRLNGMPVLAGDFAVGGPGAGLDGIARESIRWALVVLSAGTLAPLLPQARRLALLRPRARAVLRANPRGWERTVSLMDRAAEVAAREPGVFAAEEARRSLRASVLDMLVELLAGCGDIRPARVLRASRTHHAVVRHLDERLRAAPQQALRLAGASPPFGLTRSRVDATFRASFGMSFRHYARLRRLALARTALHAGEPRHASPKEFAEAFGFRDEADFAREHQDLFDEAPAPPFGQGEEQLTADRQGAGGVPLPA